MMTCQNQIQKYAAGGQFLLLLLLLVSAPHRSAFAYENTEGPRFAYDLFNLASDDNELSRLDVLVKMTYEQLQFIKTDSDSFRANYLISVEIRDEDGKQVATRKIDDTIVVGDIEVTKSQSLYTLKRITLDLAPQEYKFLLEVTDVETRKTSKLELSFPVQDYSGTDLMVSNFLYLEDYDFTDGRFSLQPRVSEVQLESSKLFAYFEVYNVAKGDSFFVEYEIRSKEAEDDTLFSGSYWSEGNGGVTKQVITLIEENNLGHGEYATHVRVSDTEKTIQFEAPFRWFIAGLPEQLRDLDQAIAVLKYIASKGQMKKLKKSENKHRALLKFWQENDPTPETPENEYMNQYYARVLYANQAFRAFNREGWKTDMGWVFIMIGPADEIHREPYNNQLGSGFGRTIKAIQIWGYYSYNQELIFLDENGFGDFRLYNTAALYEILR
jgi:GWxTD domain-containing protein